MNGRDEDLEPGAWRDLRCDVCGDTFNGFHKLFAGDRCCPYCYALATIAGPGIESPDVEPPAAPIADRDRNR